MLGLREIEQLISKYIGDFLKENISREEALLEFCKAMFLRKYGIDAFKKIISGDEEISRITEWNQKIAREDIDFSGMNFCEVYDNFLNEGTREKTGSFYTPKYVIDFMVERTLILYIHRETGISQETLHNIWKEKMQINEQEATQILQIVKNIRVVDIACGTGLFILSSLEKIYVLQRNLETVLGETVDVFQIKKKIVETSLFGIDIQKNPIEILKMTLLSQLYDANERNYSQEIEFNIITGDSLLEDIGRNNSNFYRVIHEEKGFDIVLGNPPYLGEKGNKEIFQQIQNTEFGKRYYEGKMDYFYFFIYKGLEVLKSEGMLAYITTNYFVTADGATFLRRYLKESCTFLEIVNFNEFEVFKSAKGQHNMIFFLEKELQQEVPIQMKYVKNRKITESHLYDLLHGDVVDEEKFNCYQMENQDRLYGTDGHMHIQGEEAFQKIIHKITCFSEFKLGDLCSINQGIVSGADKVTKEMLEKKLSMETITKNDIELNDGIFVLDQKEVEVLGLEGSPYLKPMYKNSDIYRYRAKTESTRYILYITDNNFSDVEKYTKVIYHLSQFKEVLDIRRETMQGIRNWYALQWPRQQEIFEKEKIIVPHRGKENRFAFNDVSWYASADVYFITSQNPEVDLKLLLAQLNSKLMYFWLYNRGKRKGADLELYANPLKSLPILLGMDSEVKKQLISCTEQMIENENNVLIQATIDMYIYKLYGLSEQDIEIIENLYRDNVKK